MVEFKVDIDVLRQLNAQLSSIHESLASAKSDFSAAEATLGSDKVASALSTFCSGWKDGRAKIEGETQALATAIQGVADAYAQGEHVIEGSFTPKPPPIPGGGHGVR